MILAADVGGTKTDLALYPSASAGSQPSARASVPSGHHHSLQDLLERFLERQGSPTLEAACLAVAGPVVDGRASTTNLPWRETSEAELAHALGTDRVRLVNDLEATALGVVTLPDARLVELNPDADPPVAGTAAVLAAGTGLGMAQLFWDGQRHHPVPGEGGHQSFAPSDDEELELWRFARDRIGGAHVSWERLVSGPGIELLYRFARARSGEPEPAALAERLAREEPAAVIGELGLSGEDPACARALALFVRLYGAVAGDLALVTLARGGVYLAGGIAPRMVPAFRSGAFLDAFASKGRFEPLLRRVPVRLGLEPAAALLGAHRIAARLVER